MTQREQIMEWMRCQRGYIATSDIITYSSSINCNTGDRLARNLREEGLIRRLTEDEVEGAGLSKKQGYYEVVRTTKPKTYLFSGIHYPE